MIGLLLVFLLVFRWTKKLNIQAKLGELLILMNCQAPQQQQQQEKKVLPPPLPPQAALPGQRLPQATSLELPRMALRNPGQILVTPLQ